MIDVSDDVTSRQQRLLLGHFGRAGYATVDPPILGPSSVFLDFSGEAIRSGLFLTTDAAGVELCLRPEFTIPVCRAHLAGGGRRASYCYAGPVFRSDGAAGGQFIQSGLESFGRADIATADAEVLALALEGAAEAGFTDPVVRMGDAGLLARLFDVLDVPADWRRRLKRGLGRGRGLDAILAEAPAVASDRSGVLTALSGTDPKGARDLVEDLLAIAGIATVGGRTAGEIAERFLRQVGERSAPAFGDAQRAVLARFLAIRGTIDDAALMLRDFAGTTGCDLGGALDLFDERANFIAAHGLDAGAVMFDSGFLRNLDYYTGFIFEARRRGAGDEPDAVVVGGGRYDGLAEALGSPAPLPAVGASVFVERLGGTPA